MSIRRYIEIVEWRARLDEKIVAPPANLARYLKSKHPQFRKIAADLAHAKEQWDASEREGADLLRTFLRYGTDDAVEDKQEIASDAVYYLPSVFSRPNQYVPAEEIERNIELWIKFDDRRFGEHLRFWLEKSEPLPERIMSAIEMVLGPAGERGAADYGYDVNDPSSLDDEYRAAIRCLQAARLGARALKSGSEALANMGQRLGAHWTMRDGLAAKGDDRERGWRPEHAEVETLYHATAFADEIVRDGFRVEPPEGRRGLGNFGTQDGISFTYDLQIAQNIVRVLKEMWMIAHGQLTARHIIGWMRHENIGLSGIYTHVGKPAEKIESKEDTAKLYNYWLWMTKTRDNPVMIGPDAVVRMMQHRPSVNDIGIVAAEVRLQPNDQFLVAEREFRVPADRVLSVKRVM